MKSVVIVYAAVLLIVCLPILIDGLHDCRTEQYTQNFAEISTGAYTSANVSLSQTLYGDDISSVSSVSSNISGDSPSANTYNPVSKILNVGGLISDSERTLSVTYEISDQDLDIFTGLSALLIMAGLFLLVVILGLFGGAIVNITMDIVNKVRGV